ncbi:methyltransferase domain-containing protein [Silvanigrella aquatica]|uniref:Polyamine aminopropyltransferase n=1 Tax=Silvanigrella aquatica TaxID=1915309 RepID=A0A1L4CZC8_9BACT|nr:methyltransferase domain-containing protein [Silvanigrella aquatica]APJ03302.1 hypothetical protein AXG55_05045 [Silvanigrella aquatica]
MSQKRSNSNIWMTDRLSIGERYHSLISQVLYQGKSQYQNISVVKLFNESKALYLDNQLQSTTADEFIYHESLIHIPFISHKNPENVLIIGAGEGATAREALKWNSVKKITLIEIDEDVILSCNKYLPEMSLGAYQDSKVEIIITDARDFLKNNKNKYDVIICDLCDQIFDENNILNNSFLLSCKNILSQNGIMCIQSGEIPVIQNPLFEKYLFLVKSLFLSMKLYSVWIPSYCRNWAFILLSDNKITLNSIEDIKNTINCNLSQNLKFINEKAYLGLFHPPKYIQEFEK